MNNLDLNQSMTSKIITNIINELKKKYNKEKIMKYFIDPIIKNITDKYYSYFLSLMLILIFMVVMLIILILLIIFNRK
jgi:hypothetical protein